MIKRSVAALKARKEREERFDASQEAVVGEEFMESLRLIPDSPRDFRRSRPERKKVAIAHMNAKVEKFAAENGIRNVNRKKPIEVKPIAGHGTIERGNLSQKEYEELLKWAKAPVDTKEVRGNLSMLMGRK